MVCGNRAVNQTDGDFTTPRGKIHQCRKLDLVKIVHFRAPETVMHPSIIGVRDCLVVSSDPRERAGRNLHATVELLALTAEFAAIERAHLALGLRALPWHSVNN